MDPSPRPTVPTYSERDIWLIALALILVDIAVFMIPIVPLVAGYVLVVRPPWFKQFVDDIYENA